ncbi:hypothetical protein OM427_16395 [Halomonas sp. 18H]|uniref:LPS-assembly lipoprotein LptE n=1 Tax=Halomonas almeriensis TaxID=308163 RepID=UPI0022301A95|nr:MULTISPECIES: LPS assembly lipoprotein LptE [Halomonas]MCW4151112.1 hypothetical protein [Halomonas sp. 18H]MDN3552992.1 hypothetical protein [Halomonas almeriensis]
MQRRHLLRLSLAAVASMALAGCGFQLRGLGNRALPFRRLDLDGRDEAFTRQVREQLTAAGVSIGDDARLRLNLGPERFSKQRLSVLNAGYQEYDMRLEIAFSVQRTEDGAYRLPEQRLAVQERYSLSSEALLTAEEQRSDVRQRLRDEALERLWQRLRLLDEPRG